MATQGSAGATAAIMTAVILVAIVAQWYYARQMATKGALR